MRNLRFVFIALCVFLGAAARAQEAKQSIDLPCKLTDYRIPDKKTIVIRCDGVLPVSLSVTNASLYRLQDESVVYPAEQDKVTGSFTSPWLKFGLTKDLQANQDYELRVSGTFDAIAPGTTGRPHDKFSAVRFRFSTRPDLAVVKAKGSNVQELSSHFAITLVQPAKLIENGKTKRRFDLQLLNDPNDYDAVGVIKLVQRPSSLDQKLDLQGVEDVFGRVSKVKPAKPAAPGSSPGFSPNNAKPPTTPSSKDSASWYFNFLHQAGVGIKPSWIANIKAAPTVGGLPHGFVIAPALNVDVGQGQVGQTKTNDLINPKLGASRLTWLPAGILEAFNFNNSWSYETNRAGSKKNMLFDDDTRIYLKGLENTKAQRTRDMFLKKRAIDPTALPQDAAKALYGYSIQLYAGAEIGASITDNTVKSSDKSSQVVVHGYDIRRFRSHASATLEVSKFTITVSAFARRLFSTETLTRENNTVQPSGKVTKTIVLDPVSGWRGNGECSISFALDAAGHYSLNTDYKLGGQPPNFDRANVVQSGLLIKF